MQNNKNNNPIGARSERESQGCENRVFRRLRLPLSWRRRG